MATEIDTILKELADIRTFNEERIAAGIAPVADEVTRLTEGLTNVQKAIEEYRRSQIKRLDASGALVVRDGRFAGLNMAELRIAYALMKGQRDVKPDSLQEVLDTQQSLRKSIDWDYFLEWEELSVKQAMSGLGESRGMGRVFGDSLAAWRGQMLQVFHKAMDSTTAGSGDELVPTLEAAQLWMDVNLETKILPLFIQSPMPSNPFDIPGQLGDVDWYPTNENEAGTTTTKTTSKTTLTAYELKAGVPFSDTLEEDAIIALVPEIRRSLSRNAAEVIDDVILNADTTESNGINSDGAVINKSTAGKAQWLLGFDGLLHLALVDNTGQGNAHSSTVTAAMFNANQIKLAKYAAPSRRGDVVHISDINTALKALTIDEVETVDKMGPRATISSGELASVYAVPYIMSEQMKLADTDGKVTDSGGNTTGRVLTVNTTQWRTAFRRQVMFEPDREPSKSQTTLYVSFRIALAERTGTRASATHTALQYDISSVT